MTELSLRLAVSLAQIAAVMGVVMLTVMILTLAERKVLGWMQDRMGPNRAALKIGKFELRIAGLLHTAADGVKFFTKEDFMPPKADKLLFSLAPMRAMAPVFALMAVIPSISTTRPRM